VERAHGGGGQHGGARAEQERPVGRDGAEARARGPAQAAGPAGAAAPLSWPGSRLIWIIGMVGLRSARR
jgi:hypothetical protein